MHYTDDDAFPEVTDQMLLAARPGLRPYTLVILKAGPKYEPLGPNPDWSKGVGKIIWQHGKRNLAMRLAGLMPIVCPVSDDTEVKGIGIFDASLEDADRAMAADPGVRAGVFTYELHPTRSFAGSALA